MFMRTETFRIDTYLAPGDVYHFAHKELGTTRPPFRHRHDCYELFLIERGETRHWINGRSETLARGMLCFIRPDDAHAFQAKGGPTCRLFNVMFSRETADHLQSRYGRELGRRFFWKEGRDPELLGLTGPRLERAINALSELQHSRRTLARIEQFLLYVMTRIVDHSLVAPDSAPQWLANACLAARSPEVFRNGVPGFVRVAGRGHEHVCRVTRRYLGMSPTDYLTRIRMEHAALLLASSETPIPDISLDCGIENLSHFYKTFRGVYGTTPLQYRKRHRLDPVQPSGAA